MERDPLLRDAATARVAVQAARGSKGRLHAAFVLIWVVLGAPVVGRAADGPQAERPPAPAAPTGPTAIPALDIPTRAERTTSEVYRLRALLGDDPDVAAVEKALPNLQASLEQLERDTPLTAVAGLTGREVEDVGRQWRRAQRYLTEWDRTIARKVRTIEAGLATIREQDQVWRLTDEQAAVEKLPGELRGEIAVVRRMLDETRAALGKRRDALLALASRIGSLNIRVSGHLAEVADMAAHVRRALLEIDAPPLWTALASLRPLPVPAWRRTLRDLAAYADDARGRLLGYGVLFLLLLAMAVGARRQAGSASAGMRNAGALQALVQRPVSAAFVVTALLAVLPGRNDPVVASEVAALIILIPLQRFLAPQLHGQFTTLIPMLGAILILSTSRMTLPTLSTAARLALLVENLGSAAWLVWVVRVSGGASLAIGAVSQRRIVQIGRVVLVGVAISVVSNLVGNVSLAVLLSRVLLGSMLFALGLWGASMAAEALITVALRSRRVRQVRAIANHAAMLERRTPRVLDTLACVLWIGGTLQLFGQLRPALALARSALAARLTVGSASLSAGDVVVFFVTIYVSLLVARVVRALLQDDVLPRLALPRGVPNAVSAAANYVILLVGFLFAVSAAGLDLSRVTILAGALGVGIGFGLQNVVNNFVSGLILLVERPFGVGDSVEVGGVAGWIRRIGIRSSTITTFDGADVIVPNGTLIAERVTNWTFADHRRRIQLPVGVAYEADPPQVVALLEATAKQHPDVFREPVPQALLVGFGPSSLDFVLNVWTRYEQWTVVRSDLIAAVHAALREAGVEIPFPQQVLRVRPADGAATPPIPNGAPARPGPGRPDEGR